jgi:hypothetical protein
MPRQKLHEVIFIWYPPSNGLVGEWDDSGFHTDASHLGNFVSPVVMELPEPVDTYCLGWWFRYVST